MLNSFSLLLTLLVPQGTREAQLLALCPLPSDMSERDLPLREEQLSKVVLSDTLYGVPWRKLGCMRVRLALLDSPHIRTDEIVQPRNQQWLEGAIGAFLRQIEIEEVAADRERLAYGTELALKNRPSIPWVMVDRVAAVLFRAVERGDTSMAVRAACPRLLLAVSDTASAWRCLRNSGSTAANLPSVSQLKPDLDMNVKIFRLWEPRTRQPFVLTTLALRYAPRKTGDRPVECGPPPFPRDGTRCLPGARLTEPPKQLVTFSIWDGFTQSWRDDVHSARLDDPENNKNGPLVLTGFQQFPVAGGMTGWSVGIRQDQDGVGGRRSVDGLEQIPQGELFLSDLVFGSKSQNTRTLIGEDSIWLAPFETLNRREPIYIYFQVGSEQWRPKATTRLRINLEGATKATPENGIQFEFGTPLYQGITGVTKQLVVDRLQPGNYAVEVTVNDAINGLLSSRTYRMRLN